MPATRNERLAWTDEAAAHVDLIIASLSPEDGPALSKSAAVRLAIEQLAERVSRGPRPLARLKSEPSEDLQLEADRVALRREELRTERDELRTLRVRVAEMRAADVAERAAWGLRVKRARVAAGLTQRGLQFVLEYESSGTIGNVEAGRWAPPPKVVTWVQEWEAAHPEPVPSPIVLHELPELGPVAKTPRRPRRQRLPSPRIDPPLLAARGGAA